MTIRAHQNKTEQTRGPGAARRGPERACACACAAAPDETSGEPATKHSQRGTAPSPVNRTHALSAHENTMDRKSHQ